MTEYPEIDPENYYDDYGEAEWERLAGRSFEFENTATYLREYLPEAGRVLDAGGGAGRYAVWLAGRGHEVVLADLSGEQRRIAREKATGHGVADRVTVEEGDVRDLRYEDEAFDAVCCLGGPLSHVVDADGRESAVRELRRVARPGAPVFVSVMGFLAVVQELIRIADEFPQQTRHLPDLVERGTYDEELLAANGVEEPTFVACHFFRAAELRDLVADAGLDVRAVAGLEGPASNFEEAVEAADPAAFEAIREVVTDPDIREDPAVADISNHLLAVGRVPRE